MGMHPIDASGDSAALDDQDAASAHSSNPRRTRLSARVSALVSRFEGELAKGETARRSGGIARTGQGGKRPGRGALDRLLKDAERSDSTGADSDARTPRTVPDWTQEAATRPQSPPAQPGNAISRPSRDNSLPVRKDPFDPFHDRFAALSPTLASQDSLLAELLAADARGDDEAAVHAGEPAVSPTQRTSVPLHRVFARDAEPLVLPGLDDAIRSLGGPASFSPMKTGVQAVQFGGQMTLMQRASLDSASESCVKGDAAVSEVDTGGEQLAWDLWVRDGPPRSRWSRFKATLRRRIAGNSTRAKRDDDDNIHEGGLSPEQARRSLLFPPFHLLPPGVTVTDLKQNRHRPQPLLTLQSALGIVGNAILGAAGSNKGISLTTVEGIRDLIQLASLFSTSQNSSAADSATPSTLRTVFVTVPAFLSLEFGTAFGRPLTFLLVLTVITLVGLYELMRFTGGWKGPAAGLRRDEGEGYDCGEGLRRRANWRDSRAYRLVVTFWCTSVYLPLSKLAIGALVFTDDYWPVSNPFLESDSPSPPSLGEAYYGPLDFCYRTDMRKAAMNFVWIILPTAGVVVLTLSIWLPWRLRTVIEHEKPRVDAFTELGEKRRNERAEYQRLVETDPSLFSFLYRDFRRPWATFRSVYLVFKLCNVLLVVLIQKNNCLFRNYRTIYLSVVRQGCLLAFLSLYSLFAMRTLPYLDIPSNSSDVCSRVGYSLIAMLGLLGALGLPGTDPATVFVNVVLYSLSAYFVIRGMSWAQRLVKRVQRRIDFSVDIFSPFLDVEKHVKRRVWQETLAAIFLCSPEFAMRPDRQLAFKLEPTPYLLEFGGSTAERVVEDFRILRSIGLASYRAALVDHRALSDLRHAILHDLTGPDRYYCPRELEHVGTASFFGRLDVVPFPFLVLFRYDRGDTVPLNTRGELELLVEQNRSAAVAEARRVRLSLRALEGHLVFAPYEISSQGVRASYRLASLRIDRNSARKWNGYNCSSGFEVWLDYADGERRGAGRSRSGLRYHRPGSSFGLTPDCQLTAPLAVLFRQNRHLIERELPRVSAAIPAHSAAFAEEADAKEQSLRYSVLPDLFFDGRLEVLEKEPDLRVRLLHVDHAASLQRLQERTDWLANAAGRRWWYLLWDDLWRRNRGSMPALADVDFSPHYSRSICYNPMTRTDLTDFLRARGCSLGRRAFFHPGFLNQIYLRLDQILLGESSKAVLLHFPAHSAHRTSSIARQLARLHGTSPNSSRLTASTGNGTEENDPEIRQRTAFLWEEAFEAPRPPFSRGQRATFMSFMISRLCQRLMLFFGLSPLKLDWRPGRKDQGLIDLDLPD